jgi:unsaturated rhamnogalacturonyl hydrolase
MWLDGLYMAGPFYARYATLFRDAPASADAGRQLLVADQHLYDPATGLYYHGWDSSGTRPWASRPGGHSPSFWGRAIGWYGMALVDEVGEMAGGAEKESVQAVLRRAVAGIARWQDPKSGVWWQVVDQAGRPGNYEESSASCMFVYALAKAVREGRVAREPYASAATRGYAGILREFVHLAPDGSVSLSDCCAVAGLDNRNAQGRPRDGSFGYYVSEPRVQNDLKAVSAFILAGLELQRMSAPGRSTP